MGAYSEVYTLLEQTISALKAAKLAERSEAARHYAIVITELEKVIAYFKVYIEFPG